MRIYHRVEPRDFKSAHERFAKNNLDNYYDSRKRVEAMVEIMEGQMNEFNEIPNSISEMVKWINK